ncbi:hypothetical protein AMTR_s00003p00270620 [Amborella trichopoda]|uniref:Uncharacterized protein n=1 Tax=Amborella trichopoda TaxID=13333 RepID=W1P6G2_AMBTC|nr:hypothetical protein AMTR_s00003p00270620 [Amborella trichopoda]
MEDAFMHYVGGLNLLSHDLSGENSGLGHIGKGATRVSKGNVAAVEKSEMVSEAKCFNKFRGVCRENSKMGSKERQSDKFKRVCGENSEMHAVNKTSKDLRTSKTERIQLGRKFQTAISFHNCEFAESLIPLADMQG